MKSEGKIQFERRGAPRFPVAFKMSYEVVGTAKKRRARTIDISGSGVQIYARQKAELGDKLKVAIKVDEGKQVEADAVVVWVKPARELGIDVGYKFALGLKFSHITSKDSGFLAQFVEKNLKGK